MLHQSMNYDTGEHNSTDYIDKVLPLHALRYNNLNPDLISLVSPKKDKDQNYLLWQNSLP